MASACWVYAVVGRDTPLRIDSGATELTLVPWRNLAAVTEQTRDDDAPLTMDAVLRHESIVEHVREHGRALPVRFGTVFRDETSVASALAERYDRLEADLHRLGDKVELSLTALWSSEPPTPNPEPRTPNSEVRARNSEPGIRYLRSRAAELQHEDEREQSARAVARELDKHLGPLALEQRTSLLPTQPMALRSTYLLHPSGVHAFKAAFDAFRETRSGLRVLLTGPWPPYTFVGPTSSASDNRFAQVLIDATRGAPADRPWALNN